MSRPKFLPRKMDADLPIMVVCAIAGVALAVMAVLECLPGQGA